MQWVQIPYSTQMHEYIVAKVRERTDVLKAGGRGLVPSRGCSMESPPSSLPSVYTPERSRNKKLHLVFVCTNSKITEINLNLRVERWSH